MYSDLKTSCLFLPLQSRRSPDTSWPRSSSVTVRTPPAGTGHRRQTKTTWSSSTTECPRRRARPSPTSPTTCVGRTASTCCTSTRPKTTRSCPCRTRSDLLAVLRCAPFFFFVQCLTNTRFRCVFHADFLPVGAAGHNLHQHMSVIKLG